jgi:hypothetical protein
MLAALTLVLVLVSQSFLVVSPVVPPVTVSVVVIVGPLVCPIVPVVSWELRLRDEDGRFYDHASSVDCGDASAEPNQCHNESQGSSADTHSEVDPKNWTTG